MRQSLSILWERLRRVAAHTSAGGAWSAQLPDQAQRNLRWYFADGILASSQEAINLTYLTLFVLALGATKGQIGLMTSLASLMAVILLVPGAILAERLPSRKWLVVASGGGVARLALLCLAILPFFVQGPAMIAVAIGMKIVMDGFTNLSNPAWTALTADIVPLQWRGRYFGTRNSAMGVANIGVTYLGGSIITRIGGLLGYQVGYIMAFLFGAGASYSFSRLHEEPRQATGAALSAYSPKALLQALRGDRNFLMFCVAMMVWNLSLNIAGPFFSVYQVEVLKATPEIVGVLNIIASLAGLPALRFFGWLNDQWGARKVMLLTHFLIPIVPVLWIYTYQPWDPWFVQILSGAFWAGQGLAAFNFLLDISPAEGRPRYVALFQISVALSLAVGAALGGVVVETFGFATIFLVSGIGRLIGAILLWRFVRPHQPAAANGGEEEEESPALPEGALGLVSGAEQVEEQELPEADVGADEAGQIGEGSLPEDNLGQQNGLGSDAADAPGEDGKDEAGSSA